MPDPRAETILEAAIRLGRTGGASSDAVLWALTASEVVVLTPSGATPTPENLAPLVVRRDDSTFLAVFTHVDRVSAELAVDRVPVSIPAALLVRGSDAHVGIVVNPGSAGFEIPPVGLGAFRSALWGTTAPTRYFVRQLVRDGVLLPFALLRRTVSGGRPVDEVLRDVDVWAADSSSSVDKAVRMPLESDLEEISAEQAAQVQQMVAERSYRPLTKD